MSNPIFDFINLHNGEENKQKVLENVRANVSFRGSNLWILACAIVIASVGLNVNSTAVIIGAMLISPLMGPIVGAGFSLAIYDFELLKKSIKNLFIATIVSLVVATLYFYASPFKDVQSELLARTSPNIYDVLIAFFGGLVGVIAITRVEKGNPIPGVAIATALMPPLCTAGFGLAVGNYQYFMGAFFLYTINCFFICIATFLIIKYLKYEPVQRVNSQNEKQIRYGITALIFILIIPNLYLAYSLLEQKKFSQNIDHFIEGEFTQRGCTLIYKKTNLDTSPKEIELAFLTRKFNDSEIEALNKKLADYHIYNTEVKIKQDIKDIKSEILNEIGNQNKSISEKDIQIETLQQELASYKFANISIDKEAVILFPEIQTISLGKHHIYQKEDSLSTQVVVMYQLANPKIKPDTTKLNNWVRQKLQTNNIAFVAVNQ